MGGQAELSSIPISPTPTLLAMTTERTFIMIKPDGVTRGLVADIIKRFEQRGYKLVAMKFMQASEELLHEHYADLSGKGFFASLIKHIGSGPVVPMVWEGKDVVKQGRAMLGETAPPSRAAFEETSASIWVVTSSTAQTVWRVPTRNLLSGSRRASWSAV